MLTGDTPVAMPATDSQCEETNALNGPLQVTIRRAEGRPWLAAGEGSVPAQNLWLNAPSLCKAQFCAEQPLLPTEQQG